MKQMLMAVVCLCVNALIASTYAAITPTFTITARGKIITVGYNSAIPVSRKLTLPSGYAFANASPLCAGKHTCTFSVSNAKPVSLPVVGKNGPINHLTLCPKNASTHCITPRLQLTSFAYYITPEHNLLGCPIGGKCTTYATPPGFSNFALALNESGETLYVLQQSTDPAVSLTYFLSACAVDKTGSVGLSNCPRMRLDMADLASDFSPVALSVKNIGGIPYFYITQKTLQNVAVCNQTSASLATCRSAIHDNCENIGASAVAIDVPGEYAYLVNAIDPVTPFLKCELIKNSPVISSFRCNSLSNLDAQLSNVKSIALYYTSAAEVAKIYFVSAFEGAYTCAPETGWHCIKSAIARVPASGRIENAIALVFAKSQKELYIASSTEGVMRYSVSEHGALTFDTIIFTEAAISFALNA